MKRPGLLITWALLCFCGAVSAATTIQALAPDGWPAVLKPLAGRPAIVHVWGLTCGSCVGELSRWANFTKRHPEVPVVFVEFEPAALAQVQAVLHREHLDHGQHWMVQGVPDERWQYQIDPQWGGELPYTILVSRDGQRQTFSGTADFAKLQQWLARQR
ncbi:MAG: hypothetical protein V4532_02975 [Pseudomonadota bacterium]